MPAGSVSPTPARIRLNRSTGLLTADPGDILWNCGKEAFVLALVMSILGGVAVGILNATCGKMIPSLPPGLDGSPLSSVPAHWWHTSRNAVHHHSFIVLWVALFMAKLALRMAHYATGPTARKTAARALRVARRFSRHWFKLLAVNAITAFVAVMILQWTQRFTLTHFIWAAFGDVIHSALAGLARLLGSSVSEQVERWFFWYGAN